jgi:hypothetical protein
VAIVDVFAHSVGGLLAQHGISTAEFAFLDDIGKTAEASRTSFHVFHLKFSIERMLNDIEFRVFHTGLGSLAVDTITVNYLGPPGQ